MQLHNLKPATGSVKKTKRIGRGEGSGHGGTATRGNKGQQADTGYQSKRGFEGGQMPIQRRMPKRGFKNPFRVEYKVFNLGQIDFLVEKYSQPWFLSRTTHLCAYTPAEFLPANNFFSLCHFILIFTGSSEDGYRDYCLFVSLPFSIYPSNTTGYYLPADLPALRRTTSLA